MNHSTALGPRPILDTTRILVAASLLVLIFQASGARGAIPFRTQEIDRSLTVGYAVRLIDMNRDGRLDILVVDARRLIWFENPSWKRHTILTGETKPDNVCVAPHDVDGDGQLDLAVGADWRPFDTATGGTIQLLRQQSNAAWKLFPIGEEPTVHRMQWADLDGDRQPELVVVPLLGRGSKPPAYAERPVRVLAFSIPKNPATDRWPMHVIDESLHVCHNFEPVDFDGDGRTDLVIVSFEGVHVLRNLGAGRWEQIHVGEGNQTNRPNRGASEVKVGRTAASRFIATIEPWHGFEVVVYTPPASGQGLWQRQVLDRQLKWGHAVWCADLDGEPGDELVIGVRDDMDGQHRSGVRLYTPTGGDPGASWSAQRLDPGGVAVEDLAVGDLDGEGDLDIVAVGRKTGNVRIYWNQTRQ